MELKPYKAWELFEWVTRKGNDFLLLDVRNGEEFGRFKVEGPYLEKMLNVPYMEFIEKEEESVARVPPGERIRIVCAKEGSAKFVGEILKNHGWEEVAYLEGGIKTWGNLLVPQRVAARGGYELFQFIRPGKASCSYGLAFGDEMMLFDPSRNVDFYTNFARKKGCTVIRTFETHLQADYISGSQRIAEMTGAEIVGNENDFKGAAFAYTPAVDGEEFRFSNGGPTVQAVFMPGHTPGSTSYLIDDRYLVSGDAVFILSIGRPDLGGKVLEWSKMLFDTIQERIAALKGDIVVLPGHYMEWSEMNADHLFADTLAAVQERNADIYGITDESEFIRFIQENMRPQPEVYADIRKVNAGLLTVDDDKQEIMDLGKNECAASMQRASAA
jgi:glyoxylase-like metal-dependent hydrolase (beta-lactamase superfamily II)/rhodanese-related sulfurtransferase